MLRQENPFEALFKPNIPFCDINAETFINTTTTTISIEGKTPSGETNKMKKQITKTYIKEKIANAEKLHNYWSNTTNKKEEAYWLGRLNAYQLLLCEMKDIKQIGDTIQNILNNEELGESK